MEIEVLLFGPAAGAFGAERVRLAVRQPCSCESVMSQLNDQQPKLRPFVHAGRLAVNHAFARPDQLIGATDEIALISMVAGG